ncbi:MAG: PKD domain-containing protein [Anaerolineales bacterium]|nr:PKD domain-containing protein [Anaerolineales bacterium]
MREHGRWLIITTIMIFISLMGWALRATLTYPLSAAPFLTTTPSVTFEPRGYLPILADGRATFTPTPTGTSAALPDLSFRYHQVIYEDCPWGGPGSVVMRVQNTGSSIEQNFMVAINGDTDELPGLAAAQESDAVVYFESGPVGSIYALADSTGIITESDESNNAYQIIFTPPPPCPTVTVSETATITPSPTATASPTPTATTIPDSAPQIDFVNINPLSGTVPLTVMLSGSATADADSDIVRYTWSLGDGTITDGAEITHTYNTIGFFDVFLQVEDDDGLMTNSEPMTVTVNGIAPEIETLSGSPISGTVLLPVEFTAVVTDTDGTVDGVHWDFGDGATAATLNPTHVYGVAGSFTATLTITDNHGLTAVDQIVVTTFDHFGEIEYPDAYGDCPMLPLIVERGNRSVSEDRFPEAANFMYPVGGLQYSDFPDNEPYIPLTDAQTGSIYLLKEGEMVGNFNWLRWNVYSNANEQNLVVNMLWPGRNEDYTNSGAQGMSPADGGYPYPIYGYLEPGDDTDKILHSGDWVPSAYSTKNSSAMRSALQDLIDHERVFRMPTYEVGNSVYIGYNNFQYRVSQFILVKLHGYHIDGGGTWLLVEFIEHDQLCGVVPVSPVPPIINAISVEPLSGTAPLTVTLSVTATAYGNLEMAEYWWDTGIELLEGANQTYTYNQPGTYSIYVEVYDENYAFTRSEVFTVTVHAPP